MIVSIASGKGGTGKTTVATNLALSLSNVQLIDCDVEEPNANVFLNIESKENEEVLVEIPVIDKDKCDFCGACSRFCAYNALAVVPSDVLVFPELCHSCGGCERVCPQNAVSWQERSVGTISHGASSNLDFYQGLLNVGESQAIPVIKALKKNINDSKNVVLDAPPGSSCPVIETVLRSDFCVLVTDATPFGLHDLKLMVDVVRHLEIPFGVVINREGVGDGNVELYCQREGIPVLMKIPHSRRIASLYSQGVPFTEEMTEWKEKFRKLFSQVKEEVK